MRVTLLIALCMALSGCMMVRSGSAPPPAKWPLQAGPEAKKSLSVNVTVQSQAPQQRSIGSAAIERYRDAAIKVYSESGVFSSVTTGAGSSSDVNADIAVIEDDGGESSFLPAFFSILTFTIVPGYVSEDVKISTVYRDRGQKVLGTFEKQERMKHWVEFFLLFAMPFIDGPEEATTLVLADLHRVTIDEAHAKGLF